MLIVDAHLDLAYNALRGRDVTQPAALQVGDEQEIPTVGLPDLRRAPVALVCATVFVMPSVDGQPGYCNSLEAEQEALRQLEWYRTQERAGRMTLVRTAADLTANVAAALSASAPRQPAILLMEGADPLFERDNLSSWYDAGLRIVGLAWKRTCFAGGTGAPGPLTREGVAMVRRLDSLGIIHDLSHLAEDSFWQLLSIAGGGVIASHSNCRHIVPTDRQLSDDMLRAIARRDGVIGINFYDKFLLAPSEYGRRRATLADVVAHIRHVCDIVGDARHVAIGTDMDGGLGRDQIPVEISSSADLPRLAESLSQAAFSDADIAAIMGGNWVSLFARLLPA